MNYFEFYNIPISFKINNAELKKIYFQFSRKYHPDFFVNASEDERNEALELSTLNTNAFKVLSDFDARMKYVFQLLKIIDAEEKFKLPTDFLMEMMELNEAIDELQFQPDSSKKEKLISEIKSFENNLYQSVEQWFEADDLNNLNADAEKKLLDFYFKRKYLKRLEQQLNTHQ